MQKFLHSSDDNLGLEKQKGLQARKESEFDLISLVTIVNQMRFFDCKIIGYIKN